MPTAYYDLFPGTAKTWRPSGQGGTYNMGLTSLASAAARQGDKGDFYDATYGYPEYLLCELETNVGTTVAADGNSVTLYWGQSASATAATGNPGHVGGSMTGVDGTLALTVVRILDACGGFCGVLPFQTGLTTSVHRGQWKFYPSHRYLMPTVYNTSGQTLGSTASSHILTVTPYYRITRY